MFIFFLAIHKICIATVLCKAGYSGNLYIGGKLVHGFSFTGIPITIWTGYDSVVWHFGDGSSDTGLFTTHTYTAADTYHECATVYTNCGTRTFCKDVIVAGPLKVNTAAYSLDIVKVYPNPTGQELYLAGIEQEVEYRLMNVVGVTLQQGGLLKGNNKIDVRQYPPGILILELTAKEGSRRVVRIVKE